MLKLKKPVARDVAADLGDVRSLKSTLARLGFYAPREGDLTEIPDEEMFRGIERFQDRFGLRRDGVVRPGGPTERTLRALIDAGRNRDSGPFVSTIAIVDAAVAVESAVAVNNTVALSGVGEFNDDRR